MTNFYAILGKNFLDKVFRILTAVNYGNVGVEIKGDMTVIYKWHSYKLPSSCGPRELHVNSMELGFPNKACSALIISLDTYAPTPIAAPTPAGALIVSIPGPLFPALAQRITPYFSIRSLAKKNAGPK